MHLTIHIEIEQMFINLSQEFTCFCIKKTHFEELFSKGQFNEVPTSNCSKKCPGDKRDRCGPTDYVSAYEFTDRNVNGKLHNILSQLNRTNSTTTSYPCYETVSTSLRRKKKIPCWQLKQLKQFSKKKLTGTLKRQDTKKKHKTYTNRIQLFLKSQLSMSPSYD